MVLIKRFIAYLIDLILALSLGYFYAMMFGVKGKTSGSYSLPGRWGQFIVLALFFIYFFTQELYWKKTLGKRLFNLEVVKVDGSRLTASDVLKRRIFDSLELLFIPPIAFIAILTNKNQQRIGDLLAKTMVATSSKSINHDGNI